MVSSLANTASPAAPVSLVADPAAQVILGTFAAAIVVFLVFWVLRLMTGKFPSAPQAAPLLPAGDPPPPVAGGELPPPLPYPASDGGNPYTSPGAPPLPVPAAAPVPVRFFKVPIAHYRTIDLLFIGIVFLIFAGLTAGAGGREDDNVPIDQKLRPDVLVISMFFQVLLMAMACAFVGWRIKASEWLGLRWKKWWLAIAIAPVTVFFMWCVMGVLAFSGWNTWLEHSFDIESMQESIKLLQESKDPLTVILMAVAAVIVAPITEEVVFRGYLYAAAKRFCGPVGAILFSSLVFAAAHGNVVALAPLFLLAVLLCLIYEFTGSIWASIAVHFCFNAATVTLQLLVKYGVLDLPQSS